LKKKNNILKESEYKISKLNGERDKVEENIVKERKRFIVLAKIKEYFEKVAFLNQSFTKRSYTDIFESLKAVENMSINLKQEKSFEKIKQDSMQKMRLLFDDIVTLKERSISFPQKQKFVAFHDILQYLGEDTLEKHIFNFILSSFLPTIKSKNCEVKESPLSPTPTITLVPRTDPHTPASIINETTNLLKLLLNFMSEGGFTISQELIEKYAMSSLEIGMALCGGRERETTAAAQKLCQLAKIENVDIAALAQESRVPKLLDECRKMFKEGKVFGDAVARMGEVFEGTPATGILTKITILALIEWKNEPEKLKMAFTVLIAVNTNEALKCILMIQRRLDELKQ
jgi:hypothetical protein